MTALRVMTYNVHGCIGRGGRDSTADVAAVVASCDPDVVALQELEAPEQHDFEGVHHARDIGTPLGMEVLFCRTVPRGGRHYGHALLSRKPVRLVKTAVLPVELTRRTEPRGALWATITLEDGREVQIISTHLGVRRFERAAQSRLLFGPEWLGHPDFRAPAIVCGDLNAVPRAMTYRRFARRLVDAHRAHRLAPRATFPARFPILRLDHIFVTPELKVVRTHVPKSEAARRASDHLPLVVDLEIAS